MHSFTHNILYGLVFQPILNVVTLRDSSLYHLMESEWVVIIVVPCIVNMMGQSPQGVGYMM